MSEHTEASTPGSAGEAAAGRKRHTRPVGSPCANCATPLLGPWCHVCGQYGDDYHRSVRHLVSEALEGLFHVDSRLWRTLPDLLVRPARLTRAYIEGHRAAQLPPLRMFLVVLVLLFLVGWVFSDAPVATLPAEHQAAPEKREPKPAPVQLVFGNRHLSAADAWLKQHLNAVNEHPGEFKLMIEHWSERFALLMLPVAAVSLSVLFAFQRRFLLYDHTIFAMHSLSFLCIVLFVWLAVRRLLPGASANLILLILPVHLFAHIRGVYGTGIFATLVRMAALFILSMIGFAAIALGLIMVGLASVGGD